MGSQQRSSAEFQQAIRLVRDGAIGHIEKFYVRVGDAPKPLDLPEMPVPANLNFNQWLGPLNDPKIHYHPDLCPPVSLDPPEDEKLWGAWRWYQETGNGYPADWGAHMYDIAQAALGMDGSGPVEYIPQGYKGTEYATMKYANGILMYDHPYREDQPDAKGIQFIGDKGWLKVARGYIEASDKSILNKEEKEVKAGQYEVVLRTCRTSSMPSVRTRIPLPLLSMAPAPTRSAVCSTSPASSAGRSAGIPPRSVSKETARPLPTGSTVRVPPSLQAPVLRQAQQHLRILLIRDCRFKIFAIFAVPMGY